MLPAKEMNTHCLKCGEHLGDDVPVCPACGAGY